MNLIVRQIVVGLVGAFAFVIALAALTVYAFPLENWQVLLNVKIFDVPFLYLMIFIIADIGIITGFVYGWLWRRRFKYINERLEELLKGQPLSLNDFDKLPEFHHIEKNLKLMENMLSEQAKRTQRLVTERAEEREKSLHEVVVQERNRLARELHDSVSQQLFAASMMMSAINEGNPPEDPAVKKQLTMVEKMIEQSQLEMRALLLHLRPIALKEKSLHEGMVELLVELRQKVPMEIDWKIEPLTLDKGVEDHLFRILQESVSNALRHSKAEHIHVMLIERDGVVIMRIHDNGIGFHVENAKSTGSYGLQNMQERALEIGGTFKLVSVEDEGTKLEVKVPHRGKGGE
ncbi:two-component system, NarL family, sensor histidine kinase LiaS [Evansella caseinilytica]|uniref:Sensor histidine kinase n=1 Tax=Evansella caseinilytica TaxID=1503961 RepID=A0A1H3PVW5_9BACI|nr:sensor histidine kinase [Evansella caseinilytica]SDZ04549.1 two-component system, NarL family, sensor histidine kinase LiaS [Evansella caseinilytica]